MQPIIDLVEANASWILLALSVLTLLLLCLVIGLAARVRAQRRRWKELLDGVSGETLEKLLHDHLRERLALEDRVVKATERIDVLERQMRTSKRFVGLVRFDAFAEVGGKQSFALAVYDDQGDGAVLTSLVGRADCRVYCKSLANGQSERDLSEEERQAIEIAAGKARAASRSL